MASMADIAFLLIIFFMVSSVFSADRGIVIELPETETREAVDLRELVLTITREGELRAEGAAILLADLGPLVTRARQVNPRRPVVVRSDRHVPYGVVADVMDELIQAGVRDVALPTAPEGPRP